MASCSPENRSAAIQHGAVSRQDFLLFMPYDLIAAVFSTLTANELVVCASVCQRWRSFFNDNPHIIWKRLVFRNTKELYSCPVFIGKPEDRKTKHIRSLSFDHSQIRVPYTSIKESEMAAVFKHLIKTECSYLEHLEFYDCPLSHMEFFKYICFVGVRLRSLDISNSYIDPRVVGSILNACPDLNSLEFQDCIPYVSSTFSLQPILADMPCRHLVTLQIVVDETIGTEYLGRLLRNCPQLKSLTLNSQVDWIVRDAIDLPPPETIFDAIYDAVQQSCTVLESFTFACIPYWTISEHSHITHKSPASLQNAFALSADVHEIQPSTEGQIIRKLDVTSMEDNATVKRKYATLEYYVGCPPPRMKNRSWTMLSIAVDTDVARVGYRFFPFTLGSVRKFLSDRPCLATVDLSGISGEHKYRPAEFLFPAVTGLPSLRHLILQDSDMHTISSILAKHKCSTLTKLTIRSNQWTADCSWIEDLSFLFRNTMCMLEEINFVRLDLKDLTERLKQPLQEEEQGQQQKARIATLTAKHWMSSLEQLKRVKLVHCTHVASEDVLDLVERVKGITELHIIGCEYLGDIDLVKKSLSKRNGHLTYSQ